MKSIALWYDKHSEEENEDVRYSSLEETSGRNLVPRSSRVNSLCFNPDGSQLLAAVGARILVYDTAEGVLKSALSGKRSPSTRRPAIFSFIKAMAMWSIRSLTLPMERGSPRAELINSL